MSNLQSGASGAQMIELFNSIKFPIMGVGGGFAPIGTENYFEGTTAPVGWVICDGSVLNIADYPELATYYASHYGASNHFGGDGVTTFAVPTKEGMPENADSVYGEQERVVGVWKQTVDGGLKQKPLYEKTVNCGAIPKMSTKTVSHGIDDIETVCDISCILNSPTEVYSGIAPNDFSKKYVAVDSTNIALGFTDASWNYNAHVIIQYIKSTDTWQLPTPGHSADGNGVFCVKATVAGDPNAHQYSTEEQVVGTWIDGSPEYELTYHFNSNVQVPSQTWAPITGIDATNIKMLTRVTIIREDAKFVADMMADVDNGKIELMNTRSQSIAFNVLIARYTKTS